MAPMKRSKGRDKQRRDDASQAALLTMAAMANSMSEGEVQAARGVQFELLSAQLASLATSMKEEHGGCLIDVGISTAAGMEGAVRLPVVQRVGKVHVRPPPHTHTRTHHHHHHHHTPPAPRRRRWNR